MFGGAIIIAILKQGLMILLDCTTAEFGKEH